MVKVQGWCGWAERRSGKRSCWFIQGGSFLVKHLAGERKILVQGNNRTTDGKNLVLQGIVGNINKNVMFMGACFWFYIVNFGLEAGTTRIVSSGNSLYCLPLMKLQ